MDLLALQNELAAINPSLEECPPEFQYHSAALRAKDLCADLERAFNEPFPLDLGIQDATFHASILIPPALSGPKTASHPSIRLSNFQRLAVITAEEQLRPDLRQAIAQALMRRGYRYLPFSVFGDSFATRERHNGDLFNQLFDYV
ncbi:MAG TPA: hypothetical protein VD886_17435 [Herpetosiphonaceae bacterium]|nr:hypothetical protein [Herpetosiphonaceae bacterium]